MVMFLSPSRSLFRGGADPLLAVNVLAAANTSDSFLATRLTDSIQFRVQVLRVSAAVGEVEPFRNIPRLIR